jgi:hypothetical protein
MEDYQQFSTADIMTTETARRIEPTVVAAVPFARCCHVEAMNVVGIAPSRRSPR